MPPPDRPFPARVTDQQVQTLLTRHRCPTPMHVLRMRFLGAIASPRMEVSPIQWVTQAWGGELPEFASEVEAEELFQALLGGWWNRLSEHQNARSPFRLPRSEVKPTRPAMLALALARQQELAGFVEGNPREPVRAHVRTGSSEAKLWLDPHVRAATSYGFDAAIADHRRATLGHAQP